MDKDHINWSCRSCWPGEEWSTWLTCRNRKNCCSFKEGEINAKEKKYNNAIALLKEAVHQEDALNYDEPPDWFFSVRHHLGAIQNKHGLYADAINTYNQDLSRLPKNGWALHGLKLAYEKLNDTDKVSNINKRLAKSWVNADIALD